MKMEETSLTCNHCNSKLLMHSNTYFCSNNACDWVDDCNCNICKQKELEAINEGV